MAAERKAIPSHDAVRPSNGVFRSYLRIFTYASPWDVLIMAVAIMASIAMGLMTPLMNVVVGGLVNTFTALAAESQPSKRSLSDEVQSKSLTIFYVFLTRFCLSYLSHLCFRMIGIRLSGAIRLAYLQALFSQPVQFIDALPSGQVATTITARANELQLGVSENLGQFLQALAMVIGSIAAAFWYSWLLTLITCGVVVLVILYQVVLSPWKRKRATKIDAAISRATSIASEALGSIRMIIACGAEDRILAHHDHWIEQAKHQELRFSPLACLQFAPLVFAIYSNTTLTFWFGIHEFILGQIANVGTIVVVLMCILAVFSSIGQIIAPLEMVFKASLAATDFFSLISRTHSNPSGLRDAQHLSNLTISFRDVHFSYPNRAEVKVLDGLGITFEAGKMTAIVGPSGSGKSTVIALIQKWYSLAQPSVMNDDKIVSTQTYSHLDTIEPESESKSLLYSQQVATHHGNVYVGDVNLEGIETKSWRSRISLVSQTPFLFDDTIRNNVLFGLQGSQWEHADKSTKEWLLKEACKEAYADEFISQLPQGYDTMVGDVGIKMSGGQRQRLAIARSIIKKPDILILDEATSAMDVHSEQIVQTALDRISRTRTTIVIAHRLSTIKNADKIVVMKSGKVVEQGTHETLISKLGVYYDLVNAQSISINSAEPVEKLPSSPSVGGHSFPEENESFMDDEATVVDDEDIDLPLLETELLGSSSNRDITVRDTERNEPRQRRLGLFRGLKLLLVEQKHLAPWYALTIVGAIIAGAGLPMQSYVVANLINVFLLPRQELTSQGNLWAFYSFILALAVGLGYAAIGYSGSRVSAFILKKYRQEHLESIIRQPIPFFDDEKHSAGTMIGHLNNDTVQLQQLMGLNMVMVLTGFVNIIGCVAISFGFGWKLALVNLFFTFPFCIVAGFLRLRFEKKFEGMYAKVFANSSKFAAESVSNYRTVISLTMEQHICQKYDALLQEHTRTAFLQALYSTVSIALGDSMSLATEALLCWYGGKLLSSGESSLVDFLVNFLACAEGGEAAGQWLSFIPNIALASAAMDRIFGLRHSFLNGEVSSQRPLDQSSGGVRVALENVRFRYPTRDATIFNGLNLIVEKGQFAALVGTSGSGKSSVISLIERFYEVENGRITWDGESINRFDMKQYRQAISLVAQESSLIQGTIRENVLIGVADAEISELQLHQACRDAGIHDFIVSLPNGYATEIGARGISLSGGQAQRLSIARALIRNPRLLLLDEATSNLDSESERVVQESLKRIRHGRTMIVVAHRLATIKDADIIFVMGQGQILEKGSHAELLALKGQYWSMCQSQTLQGGR